MSESRPLTIACFWTGVSPTMTACWRALAALPHTRVVVFLELPAKADTAFDHATMLEGIECRVYHAGAGFEPAAVEREIAAVAPDVMVVLGWRSA